jgi:hypothetical protein
MKTLKPEFVEYIPKDVQEGVLYISMQYRTAVHACACGCGEKVVTRLSPKDWRLTYDGTVTLDPSIGNWNFPCRSHYFIRKNQIIEAQSWKFSFRKIFIQTEKDTYATDSQVKIIGKNHLFKKRNGRKYRRWLNRNKKTRK